MNWGNDLGNDPGNQFVMNRTELGNDAWDDSGKNLVDEQGDDPWNDLCGNGLEDEPGNDLVNELRNNMGNIMANEL